MFDQKLVDRLNQRPLTAAVIHQVQAALNRA